MPTIRAHEEQRTNILSTTFFEEGKHNRNRFWDLLFEEKEEFYDYEQVYGGKVVNNHPDELWIYINGINCYLEVEGTV